MTQPFQFKLPRDKQKITKEAVKALTQAEYELEIKERIGLYNQMVGWLYSGILSDEIDHIKELRTKA